MKKKIPMILAFVMSTASLTACSLPFGNNQHEHTFSDKYTQNATHHWFAATCEHGEEKLNYGEHTDTNEDGVCDVCAYETGHTHTFSEDWSKDGTHHWHAATCTHTDEKGDNALHTDANVDGVCDVCEGHVHVVNDAGYCELCNTQVTPLDENNIESVINAMLSQQKNINGGQISETFNSETKSLVDENGVHPYAKLQHYINYTLGNNAAYVTYRANSEVYNKNDFGDWTFGKMESLNKTWFYTENNVIYGFEELTTEKGMVPQFVTATEDNLAGYYFAVSTLADGYGAETVLFNLYTLSQEDSASAYNVSHDAENNKYAFSFNSLIINTDTAEGEGDSVRYYETTVTFGYSDNYELTSLTIKCDAYTNDAGTNTGEADVDYDYDQATQTITMRDTAEPDTYTFSVTQTVGERTYVHDKDISVYLPKGFNFEVENGATLTYDALESVIIPFEADPVESFEMVKANGMVDAKLICNSGDSSSFAFIDIDPNGDKSIFIENIAVGEYTLNFYYLNEIVWSASINVTAPIVVGDYVSVVITDNNTFEGQLVEFEAPASGTYTFNIPAGFGAVDKEEWDYGGFDMSVYVDPYFNPNGGSFSVDIAKGDTYAFYISAPTKGTHTITYTFEAKDVVSGGDNEGGGIDYTTTLSVDSNTLYFSADEVAAGTATRTLVITKESDYKFASSNLFVSSITDSSDATIAKNADYTYTLSAGTYSVHFSSLAMFGVKADEACTLTITSTKPEAPAPAGNLFEGDDNLVEISNDDINKLGYVLYNFMPWNDGEFQFTADFDCIIMDADGNELGTNSAILVSFTTYTVKLDVSSLFLGGNYNVSIKWIAPLGAQENPYVLEQLGDYTANYAGTYTPIWYVYTPAEDGTLTITNGSATASVMCGAAIGYEECPEAGESLTMSVVAGLSYYIGVADWDAMEPVEIAFNVAFTAGEIERDGTRNTPYALSLGEMTCNVPEYEVVIYTYTATADGTLTATTTSENFDFNFNDTLSFFDTNVGSATVSIDVVAGQTVYLFVSTANMSASVLDFTITFEELTIIDVTTLSGDGTFDSPYVLTGAGTYDMGTVNSYPGYYISITAETETTVTLTSDLAQLYAKNWNMLADASESYTVTIAAGESFTFIVCMETGMADVLLTVVYA